MQDDEDLTLWQAVIKNITPLKNREKQAGALSSEKTVLTGHSRKKPFLKNSSPSVDTLPTSPKTLSKEKSSEIDRRTDMKLQRGQFQIDATLDLHGLRQHEAHEALIRFINQSYQQNMRCILVITGKGGRDITGHGVLRQRLPGWLEQAPLNTFILRFYPAKPKDGGSGAFYVLLRRKR